MKKDWELKRLDEVAERIEDIPHLMPKAVNEGNKKFISTKDFTEHGIDYSRCKRISEGDFQKLAKKIQPRRNDILFSRIGTIGEARLVDTDEDFIASYSIVTIRANLSFLIPNFLLYALQSPSILDQARKGVRSVAMPDLGVKIIKAFQLPVPPLPEQQRIVSVLDEAFASIAQAKSNAEQNLVNAQELFEAVLQYEFENAGKSWEEKRLGDVTHLITDGKHGDCRDEENSGYYFLSAKDVKYSTLNYEKARQIKKEDFEETHRRTNLKPGDVLVTNSGTIGRMAIAPDDDKTYKTTFQKSVAVIKPIPSILDNVFCCYHLKADLSKLVNVSAGTAQKNLLIGDLKNHLMKIPPLAEQRAIVGRLEALSAETRRLEEIYQQKVESLEELKKSVLGKAFAGEI